MWRTRVGRLCVVLYHEVSEETNEFLDEPQPVKPVVSPALFEYQLSVIQEAFRVIGPDELLRGEWQEGRCALLTFDDGCPGALRTATAILHRRRLPSLFFVNYGDLEHGHSWAALNGYLAKHDPDYIRLLHEQDGPEAWQGPLSLRGSPELVEAHCRRHGLDMDQVHRYQGPRANVRDLEECAARYPGVYFGNHLFRHYNAARLSPEGLEAAYRQNAAALARFANSRPLCALPFGIPGVAYTRATLQVIRAAGAQAVFSAFNQVNVFSRTDIIHRISLGPQHTTRTEILARLRQTGLKAAAKRGLAAMGVRRYGASLSR